MNESVNSLYAVTVDQAVRLLSRAYLSLIEQGLPLRQFPSVMLWGPPGVGKSQGIRSLAVNIEKNSNKRVIITDIRLLLFNPVDLRGIPTANADKTLAVWLKPQILQMDENDDVINLLFLDEITAAPPSVQAAAYQITLDRTVGEHKLPENCIVIAAGNRVTDKSVAFQMPRALANRLCHLEIKQDAAAWHDWAIRTGLHPYVIGYLEYNSPALLRSDPGSTDPAFPTPRSWEMVSRILYTVPGELREIAPLIIGCIGYSATAGFSTWVELYRTMPAVEAIFAGEEVAAPTGQELQIALRSAMVEYARNHPQKKGIDRSIEYACKLPWAFRGKLLHDYYYTPGLRAVVEQNPIFKTAIQEGLQ